jgi:hypothetical protein
MANPLQMVQAIKVVCYLHMLNTQVVGSMMLIKGECISLRTIQVIFSLNTSTLNITTG